MLIDGNPAFCIDRTEVTAAAYTACVTAGRCSRAGSEPGGNGAKDAVIEKLGWLCTGSRDDRLDHPVNCVDWNQAKVFCEAGGAHLLTRAEFQYAATGAEHHTYPWGNEPPDARRVNACGPECVAMFERTLGIKPAPLDTTNDGWEATAPVGSFPAGATPAGVLDLAGNVGEWVMDWSDDTQTRRLFMGGGWDLGTPEHLRSERLDSARPEVKSVIVGFRCARKPR